MRFFTRTNTKVYTTEDHAVDASEDVGVEGKRYPAGCLGRGVARCPCLFLTLSMVPLLVFFIIGCVKLRGSMVYTVADFQLGDHTWVMQGREAYRERTFAWADTISSDAIEFRLDPTIDRNIPQATVELRAVLDRPALVEYGRANGWTAATIEARANLLDDSNVLTFGAIERQIWTYPSFRETCFTNDLMYGWPQFWWPECAPPGSLIGYAFPSINTTSQQWVLDGRGGLQSAYLDRLLRNPSYAWFTDAAFNPNNRVASQLRAQFVLSRPFGWSAARFDKTTAEFLTDGLNFIRDSVRTPYVHYVLGGASVDNAVARRAAAGELYKIAIAAILCLLFSYWHSFSLSLATYTALLVMCTYLGACGLYAVIYKQLPLMTVSAVLWVMTFCMHATLNFYDTFVYSGVMATKGRRNNLSVPQRVSFCLRRATMGVWVANILAIILFAINTTSAFVSVHDFSVLMMIAFLWNMYAVLLATPAFVALHHFHFSGRRRNLQKQRDILNHVADNCRRDPEVATCLRLVQENAAEGERVYSLDADLLGERIGARRGVNSKKYKGVGDFFVQQFMEGFDKLRTARTDVTGALHKVRKTKRRVVDGQSSSEPAEQLPTFQMEDFMDIGPANPLGQDEAAAAVAAENGEERRPRYCGRRMVRFDQIVHVPPALVTRSEDCWEALTAALGQENPDELLPPQVPPLAALPDADAAAAETRFAKQWGAVGARLQMADAPPLVVRSVARAMDPERIVAPRQGGGGGGAAGGAAGGRSEAAEARRRRQLARQRSHTLGAAPEAEVGREDYFTNDGSSTPQNHLGSENKAANGGDDEEGDDGAAGAARPPAAIVDPGTSGVGLRKLRHNWRHRRDRPRSCCCGLFGRVRDETPEERMERLMSRKVKNDGYTLFERFILRWYIPAIDRARFVLLALLLLLFVALCIAGSFVKSAGVPLTLSRGDEDRAERYAALDESFGLSGNCYFCGAYYDGNARNGATPVAQAQQCAVQVPSRPPQMNIGMDLCGVCYGSNSCVDCLGDRNGGKTSQCGTCADPGSVDCSCASTHDCSYCAYELGEPAGSGGNGCATRCDPRSCGSTPGYACNNYTGQCEATPTTCVHGTLSGLGFCACEEGWEGALCDVSTACLGRGPLIPASESPTGASMCGCRGHWRGASCQLCDCENGGMCNELTGECECVGGFSGPRCQVCATDCLRHGACVAPEPEQQNVRTCIYNSCPAANIASETACAACDTSANPSPAAVCAAFTDPAMCARNLDCWYDGTACVSAYRSPPPATPPTCDCTYPSVWGGARCEECLGGNGTTCSDTAPVITGCDGANVGSAAEAKTVDACGVCGGDGICAGCDGFVGSGLVLDICGVCGGDGQCTEQETRLQVDYLVDLSTVPAEELVLPQFLEDIRIVCRMFRLFTSGYRDRRCVLEDYATATGLDHIAGAQQLYEWARDNGRLSELGFVLDTGGRAQSVSFMTYRQTAGVADVGGESPHEQYDFINSVRSVVVPFAENLLSTAERGRVRAWTTGPEFPSIAARELSRQSLWFAVGIGLAVCAVAILVYYVSLGIAVAGTVAAGIVCFGSVTVCLMLGWRLDAITQVGLCCTVPIGIEYTIHIINGYYDYLQSTTSHLFAKTVTRRTAVQGAMLRTLSSICICVVCVILSSIMFNVSRLIPSQRMGQLCITTHLFILIATLLFSGALLAVGPMKSFRHWTLSSLLCLLCVLFAGVSVACIYAAGGVISPSGERIIGSDK